MIMQISMTWSQSQLRCQKEFFILCLYAYVSFKDIAADLKSGPKSQQDSSTRLRKIKPFKLQDASRRLGKRETNEILKQTFKRILMSDSKINLFFLLIDLPLLH